MGKPKPKLDVGDIGPEERLKRLLRFESEMGLFGPEELGALGIARRKGPILSKGGGKNELSCEYMDVAVDIDLESEEERATDGEERYVGIEDISVLESGSGDRREKALCLGTLSLGLFSSLNSGDSSESAKRGEMGEIGVRGSGNVAARMGEGWRVVSILMEFFAPTIGLDGSAGTGGAEEAFLVLDRRRTMLARRKTLPIVLVFR